MSTGSSDNPIMSPGGTAHGVGVIIFASCPYPLASSLWCPGAYGLRRQDPVPLSLDAFESLSAT
jgi:hypothetical protein